MAFAVIKTGGKQYKVRAGDTLRVEKLPGTEEQEKGSPVTFDVLMFDDGVKITVGNPTVKGASVVAEFVGNARAKKILVTKFKSKTRYRRTKGHRQHYTSVRIKEIKH